MKNASGDYTQPTPVDVASALAYATQLPDGTHQLNFNGAGPNVYNPSTYSYLLTPTTGWQPAKGAVMSQFVNYVLTLGQQKCAVVRLRQPRVCRSNGTASTPSRGTCRGPSRPRRRSSRLRLRRPHAQEVAAGQTTPTCGVLNTGATQGTAGAGAGTATGSGGSLASTGGAGAQGHGVSTSGSSTGGGADPSVSLTGAASMAGTGIDAIPVTIVGLSLLLIGVIGRRLLKRRLGDAR